MCYILEFLRPEIQQYFIADNESEKPFGRELRLTIYRRAKGINDTVLHLVLRKILIELVMNGVTHSLMPKQLNEIET